MDDEPRAMTTAPTCESGGQDCLQPVPATLVSDSQSTDWTLTLADGDTATIGLEADFLIPQRASACI